eukprot:scaffold10921_cov181-Ochromonas_danica.AAC.3
MSGCSTVEAMRDFDPKTSQKEEARYIITMRGSTTVRGSLSDIQRLTIDEIRSYYMKKKASYQAIIPASVPINAVEHVNADNVGFVLNLRSTVQGGYSEKRASEKVTPADSRLTTQQASKKTGQCSNPVCIAREQEIREEEEEVRHTKAIYREIEALLEALSEAEGQLRVLEEDYSSVQQQEEKLTKTRDSLENDLAQQRSRLRSLAEEQRVLEQQVRSYCHAMSFDEIALNMSFKQIATLMARKEKQQHAQDFVLAHNKKGHLKHNGLLSMQLTGELVWSCCLRGECEGCIEEHSVGIRSTLCKNWGTLNQNRLLPSHGHPLSSFSHSTVAMEAAPRYAFWTTRRDDAVVPPSSSSPLGLGQLSRQSKRPQSAVVFGGSSGGNLQQKSLALSNQSSPNHSCREHHRGLAASQQSSLWSLQRPPSAASAIGRVRVEEGKLKKQNRPMSSPSGYLDCL